ncbi:MAG: DUF5683 domain-containing protein [Melioribacteraceae bacterium]|nr:DUF5683 domain-containing protein [Melioribacteraceae bacterium]
MKNLIIKILFITILFSVSTFSQTTDTLKSDTSLNDSGFVMQKSPMGALLRSAVIPGLGQFYNESYWKIPVIWGVSAWFIYLWNDRNDLYIYYKDQYNISLDETSNGNSSFYKTRRDFYRDDRDLFAIYLGLTYFLNLIDAYVDAHLFDFDININQYTHKPELNIRLNL